MKISNAPITLLPRHSQFIRALSHASGVSDIDRLIEELYFSSYPSDELECMSDYRGKDDPLYARLDEAIIACYKLGGDWKKFVKVAQSMKPFSAAA
jgi:hypothetical protein